MTEPAFRPDAEMFVCMDPTGCYHVSWNEGQHRAKMAQVSAQHEARYVATSHIEALEAEVERLTRERDEAQAGAYRAGIDAIDRLADLDNANERASKNWRAFRDLRLQIIGDGPMCRDCADADGRCPSSGQPCDPDEAMTEQLAKWRTAEARAKLLEDALKSVSDTAHSTHDRGHYCFPFAIMQKVDDALEQRLRDAGVE